MQRWVADPSRELFFSDLLRVEALRAASRHSTRLLREARERLDALTLLTLSTEICDRAGSLAPPVLRTLDALHLAAALTVAEDLEGVVTYERLATAAEQHGVAAIAPSR